MIDMKILLINTSERIGGAAIATKRLLRALNRHGLTAQMLVRDKQTDDPYVAQLPPSPRQRLKFLAERAEIFLGQGCSRENLWAIDTGAHGTDITRLPEFQEADVVHLNWVNQAMLSLADVGRVLASGKPVVWTLHDMWPFTGVCHHSETCEGWLTGCGNCPKLRHRSPRDLSARVFRKKRAAYGRADRLTIVACSDWLAGLARRAPLLQGFPVESIPNAIDTDFYHPGNRDAARRTLGLPEEKRLLLFVAYKATDEKKGIGYLREALERIRARHSEWLPQLGVVPVGLEAETLRHAFACDAYPQPYVTKPETMRLLYQAADLLVMPTLMDNLPNTIVEGMACGLPCVGFRVGGLPQMVHDGINGYLAPLRDAEELARLTLETLFDERYDRLCHQARTTAVHAYSEQAVAKRYEEVYEQTLR